MNVNIVLGVDNVMVTLLPHYLLKKNQIMNRLLNNACSGYCETSRSCVCEEGQRARDTRDVEQEIRGSQKADTKKVKADWGSVSVYAQKSPPHS